MLKRKFDQGIMGKGEFKFRGYLINERRNMRSWISGIFDQGESGNWITEKGAWLKVKGREKRGNWIRGTCERGHERGEI